jgi:hypothetical protein
VRPGYAPPKRGIRPLHCVVRPFRRPFEVSPCRFRSRPAAFAADPDPESTASFLGASPVGQAGWAFESSSPTPTPSRAGEAPVRGRRQGRFALSYTYAEIGYERTSTPDDPTPTT